MNKEKIVESFLDGGYLISPDFLDSFDSEEKTFLKILKEKIKSKEKPVLLNKDLLFLTNVSKNIPEINWFEFEKSRSLLEKGRDGRVYKVFLDILAYGVSEEKRELLDHILEDVAEPVKKIVMDKEKIVSSVVVLSSFQEESYKKREVNDFINYFKTRYKCLRQILENRQELQNTISISRAIGKSRERVSLIGVVNDKFVTKNKNILLNLEDPTGFIKVLINKDKKELYDLAKDIVLDEVIGIKGMINNNFVFVNEFVFPDFSAKDIKKCNEEVYAVFTADLHVGSNMFYLKDFLRFVDWINGRAGNKKQREIAKKVKYLFIVGDLVDGVGIYPDQENELVIKDIYKQYEFCADLLSKIRKDINIVICPGNHDALRISEPQPVLDKNLAKGFYELPNVTMVTNPGFVNIQASKEFEGFDILLYHGYSFLYYADNVESIRMDGGMDRPDLIMKFLLQKRHLAPSHTSTLYIPYVDKDPLVIDKVPDFFITAHLHRTATFIQKNVTMIGCGCWQGMTSFMEKVGAHPDPSKITLVNLKTRELKILNFGK